MKVRFKKAYSINEEKTILQGSELEVITGYCGTDGYYYQCIMPDGTQISIPDKYVKITDYRPYIDWEQIRANAAIAAMQGMYCNGMFNSYNYDRMAKEAVKQADALIEELKKEK